MACVWHDSGGSPRVSGLAFGLPLRQARRAGGAPLTP